MLSRVRFLFAVKEGMVWSVMRKYPGFGLAWYDTQNIFSCQMPYSLSIEFLIINLNLFSLLSCIDFHWLFGLSVLLSVLANKCS